MRESSQPRAHEGQVAVIALPGVAATARSRFAEHTMPARAIDDANRMIKSTDQVSFVPAGQAYVRDCKYEQAGRCDVGVATKRNQNACAIPSYKLPLRMDRMEPA